MPNAAFFQRLGLFVDRTFLTAEQCSTICSAIHLSDSLPAPILRLGVSEVDETSRKVRYGNIASSLKEMVAHRLRQQLAHIAEYFSTPIHGFEPPQYLHYQTGDHFCLHQDGSTSYNTTSYLARRKLSGVIFLNSQAAAPTPHCFGGGELTFYGLIDDPQWKHYGFHLEAEAGVLVVFRSDVLHEVCPVTWGDRYTIVTWFYEQP